MSETHTERTILDLLHQRYSQVSQGTSIRYAVAEHVRSEAGAWGIRTCDFIAQDLWTSAGLHLIGHEVKVSRSDWLRELKHPEKSDAFRRYTHRWYLVVSDAAIVKPGELPAGWGLIAPAGQALRVSRQSALNSTPEVSASFQASLLRAVAQTYARRSITDSRWRHQVLAAELQAACGEAT